MLGLCRKAGRLKSGEFATEESVKNGKAYLVVIANDASANTAKKFTDMCSWYEVPVVRYGTKEELARAIGKEEIASVAICDEGFSASLIKLSAQLESNSED